MTPDIADLCERLRKKEWFSDQLMAARTEADAELIDTYRAERKAAAAALQRLSELNAEALAQRKEWENAALDYLGRLDSAEARLAEAVQWQPIETAPKYDVLLYFPAKVVGAHSRSTLPKMIKVGRASDFPNRLPTHWMPLPSAPVGGSSNSAESR